MDFLISEPGDDPIVVESWYNATPDRVYRAWTEPSEVRKWFGYRPNFLVDAAIDLRPGGAYRFTFPPTDEFAEHGFEGAYEEIAPAERLAFTWRRFMRHPSGVEEFWPFSRVEVSFVAKGAGTQLRLEHAALDTDDRLRNVHRGWGASLRSLEAMFTGAD